MITRGVGRFIRKNARHTRIRCLGTFYDSQSGLHVDVSDDIVLYSLPEHHGLKLRAASFDKDKVPAPGAASSVFIEDAFDVSTTRLQTVAGALADHGFERIILNASSSSSSSAAVGADNLDRDDMQEALEAVVWNDVEGLPMSYRLGLRLGFAAQHDQDQEEARTGTRIRIARLEEHLEAALEMKVKIFEAAPGCDQEAVESLLKRLGVDHRVNA
jgi:hypothetical protein